jgi:acetyl-CoA carboxylase biotin carboxyl carrier protein
MQLSDVASLVKLLDKSSLTEISFSDENSKVVLKKEIVFAAQATAGLHTMPMSPPAGSAPFAAPSLPAASAAADKADAPKAGSKYKEVTSPMVGTFYASSTPGSAPLVGLGAAVKPGQVLCIIEAMKIMNEIESDVSGVIEEICVANETPVEYGTVLFRVRPG